MLGVEEAKWEVSNDTQNKFHKISDSFATIIYV